MNSQGFFATIKGQLAQVEEQLYTSIDTAQPILKEASQHLVRAGGKRLRPAFVLLSGSFFTDNLDELVPMAVAIELIHMATLVHDDVIDNSSFRRGRQTVKARFGNRISVYAGDYVFARALSLIGSYRRHDVINLVANASVRMCQGEIVQMQTCFNTEQNIKDYLRRIELKTALLMSLSCELGAMIAGASPNMVYQVKQYGYYLGMAFQVTDDILDFTADEEVLGKPTGSDIRQGIITLPALYALRHSTDSEELKMILGSPARVAEEADRCLEMVKNSGGIEYSYLLAKRYIDKAHHKLMNLPESEARRTLAELADFVCARDF